MAFIWDDANLEHIARHGVDDLEAEEALRDPRGVPAPAYNRDERRLAFIGATSAGRRLYTVYTKRGGDIRVITAYDADAKQKRRYRG